MNFRFLAHGCPPGDWTEQLLQALHKHTEVLSRKTVPGIWKMTDRLNGIPCAPEQVLRQRAVRRKLTGVLFLVLGLFLAIPGMRKPEELILPLVVGVFAAVTGIIRLLPRRKKEDRRLRRSAQTLLQNRAAVTEASVVFTEDGMRLDEGEPIGFDRFATAVETEDLFFFTWDNQALVLFKQELQNQLPEAFSDWLAAQTTLLCAHKEP